MARQPRASGVAAPLPRRADRYGPQTAHMPARDTVRGTVAA